MAAAHASGARAWMYHPGQSHSFLFQSHHAALRLSCGDGASAPGTGQFQVALCRPAPRRQPGARPAEAGAAAGRAGDARGGRAAGPHGGGQASPGRGGPGGDADHQYGSAHAAVGSGRARAAAVPAAAGRRDRPAQPGGLPAQRGRGRGGCRDRAEGPRGAADRRGDAHGQWRR